MVYSMRAWLLGVAFAMVMASAGVVEAAALTYTLDGGASTITGTLNGVAFANKTFSMTQTGNPAGFHNDSFPLGPYQYEVWHLDGMVTMTITDVGTFHFVNPTDMAVGSYSNSLGGSVVQAGVGFGSTPNGGSDLSQSRLYTNTDFETPFTVTGLNRFVIQSYSTSSGLLDITGQTQATGTFTAVYAIPEPSTFSLVGLGVGLLGLCARRRRS